MPGKTNRINITEHIVPSEIVSHILAAISSANKDTIKVTIMRMEDEDIIVWIDLLYAFIKAS